MEGSARARRGRGVNVPWAKKGARGEGAAREAARRRESVADAFVGRKRNKLLVYFDFSRASSHTSFFLVTLIRMSGDLSICMRV